jgi:hypothetical protein
MCELQGKVCMKHHEIYDIWCCIYIYYIYISYVYWGKHYGFQMFRAFCPLTILKRLKYPCIMSLKIKRSHFQRLQLQRLWPNHSNSQFSACRLIYHNLSVSQGLGLNYWRVFFWGTVVPRELWKQRYCEQVTTVRWCVFTSPALRSRCT